MKIMHRRVSRKRHHARPRAGLGLPAEKLEPLVARGLPYPLPRNPTELARLETEGLLVLNPSPPIAVSKRPLQQSKQPRLL